MEHRAGLSSARTELAAVERDPQARSSHQGRRLRAVDQGRAPGPRGAESRTAIAAQRSGDARAPAPAHGRRLSREDR
jgi:hypothetical protein